MWWVQEHRGGCTSSCELGFEFSKTAVPCSAGNCNHTSSNSPLFVLQATKAGVEAGDEATILPVWSQISDKLGVR